MWRVGIDVGGTFTDLFAWEEGGQRRQLTSKVLTTKEDRAVGVLNAIREAGIAPAEISHLMHGTTTATNALITRDYPEAAMITTDGFRDTIEIGRQHRAALYDPYQQKPKPIIKRRYRYTIGERMDAKGQVVRPLDRDAALAIAAKIKAANIRSVAIAFINAYVNPAHENQMRDIVLEVRPAHPGPGGAGPALIERQVWRVAGARMERVTLETEVVAPRRAGAAGGFAPRP